MGKTDNQEFKLSIEKPSSEFQEHLHWKDNKRIFLSGKFGSGKTYFLEKFFQEKSDKYLYIRLSPVNYSVASNEDIFKFIKYDILRQVNKTHGIFEILEEDFKNNNTFSNSAYLSLWLLMQNFPQVIKSLLMTVPELALKGGTLIGGALVGGVERIENMLNEHQKIKERILSFNNSPEAKEFFDEIEQKYLYENDPITIFITEILSIVAELGIENTEPEPKKKVLIIDDLDRLDPEHTFRLFNVFSSHFDYNQEYDNKFGFDKIIFCGDIDNIRQIFHAKYGLSTDFGGYIDKFYSKEIFYYDIRDVLKNNIIKVLEKVIILCRDRSISNSIQNPLVDKLLAEMILINVLNIRALEKLIGAKFEFDSNHNVYYWRVTHQVSYFILPIITILQFLSKVFGSTEELKNIIRKLIKYNPKSTSPKFEINLMELLIPLIEYKIHKLTPHSNALYNKSKPRLSYNLVYSDSTFKVTNLDYSSNENAIKDDLNIFENLLKAVEVMEEIGAL